MKQTAVPFLFMRGGTSRGPYINKADLPADREKLADVLVAAMGAGHPLNIDGLGGGATVTTKVAILSKSEVDDADVDYFFAQVDVTEKVVDFKPTCGNILSGVGPAALEMGLVSAVGEETPVRIRAVNTGARVGAVVQTPGGAVRYDGDVAIDGVPGVAAPVMLNFFGVVGGATGELLPTGARTDVIDGIDVTCMDVAMPVAMARAEAFGLTGYESAAELDENREFYARMEAVRREAGRLMGMGDVAKSVTPKFAILAPPRAGGAITARYFTPWSCHPTMAVTGAQCIAACALTPGTAADGIAVRPQGAPAQMLIEHPIGQIDVLMDFERQGDAIDVKSAGLVRTARLIARGEFYVPGAVWSR
ncbi:MAG: 4-oxalomesaconate tautomerase [Neomegalonema sp.]|nr:4-oxalomesaconate tautomerase [Neomegalonema sp.]